MIPLVEWLFQKTQYRFKDRSLLDSALTHCSYTADIQRHNERLEFLGDAALGLAIATLLYQQFPRATEGDLSRLRANLVNKAMLAALGQKLALEQYLLLGRGELHNKVARDSLVANAVEAILGAIYLDADFKTCQTVVAQLYAEQLRLLTPIKPDKDPKTQLQEYLQAQQRALPIYQISATSGYDHAKQFVVDCWIEGIPTAIQGHGSSRRKAEQAAAAQALQYLLQND